MYMKKKKRQSPTDKVSFEKSETLELVKASKGTTLTILIRM